MLDNAQTYSLNFNKFIQMPTHEENHMPRLKTDHPVYSQANQSAQHGAKIRAKSRARFKSDEASALECLL
jgi:DNA polymerase III psi subunit